MVAKSRLVGPRRSGSRERWQVCGLILLLGFLSSCRRGTEEGTASAAPSKYPYTIVTTCGMVTDIARHVAGEHAEVGGLMGEGVDPHLYKPTRSDMQQLMRADVVLYSGLLLEGRMTETFATIGRTGKPVHAVTDQLPKDYLRHPPEFSGHPDPHVWMDVTAWSQCVSCIADSLAAYDAAHASDYHRNAAAYRDELKRLDDYIRKILATIPESQRILITAHDAFGYFGRAYEIQVLAPQGISTESEASVEDINHLVDLIVERKIGAIFVESSVNSKTVRAVMEGAESRGHPLKIGGQLYSDAMGRGGTYEGTYVGMMDHNATTIVRALGGEAPEKGFQDKLSETGPP